MCHACHASQLVDHRYKINVATLYCVVPRIHRDMSIALVVWAIEQVMRIYMSHCLACVVGPNSPIENALQILHCIPTCHSSPAASSTSVGLASQVPNAF
jgi:hypothetical protein